MTFYEMLNGNKVLYTRIILTTILHMKQISVNIFLYIDKNNYLGLFDVDASTFASEVSLDDVEMLDDSPDNLCFFGKAVKRL